MADIRWFGTALLARMALASKFRRMAACKRSLWSISNTGAGNTVLGSPRKPRPSQVRLL